MTQKWKSQFFSSMTFCYKLVHSFRVTCLFTGECNSKAYGTITDDIIMQGNWNEENTQFFSNKFGPL